MKHGTKNQVKGKVRELKGAAKAVAGRVVGDEELEVEGKIEKTVGKVQQGVGKIEKRRRESRARKRVTHVACSLYRVTSLGSIDSMATILEPFPEAFAASINQIVYRTNSLHTENTGIQLFQQHRASSRARRVWNERAKILEIHSRMAGGIDGH
jgi:uncharacterized protein YjbJ (UPF0337 family)